MRTEGSLSLLVGAIALGFAQGTVAAPAKGDPESGKTLYQESCRHCHGATGNGESDLAAFLTPPPANLTSPKTQGKSDEELRLIILKGRAGTAMVGFEGAYNDEQLTDLIAYLRSLKS